MEQCHVLQSKKTQVAAKRGVPPGFVSGNKFSAGLVETVFMKSVNELAGMHLR